MQRPSAWARCALHEQNSARGGTHISHSWPGTGLPGQQSSVVPAPCVRPQLPHAAGAAGPLQRRGCPRCSCWHPHCCCLRQCWCPPKARLQARLPAQQSGLPPAMHAQTCQTPLHAREHVQAEHMLVEACSAGVLAALTLISDDVTDTAAGATDRRRGEIPISVGAMVMPSGCTLTPEKEEREARGDINHAVRCLMHACAHVSGGDQGSSHHTATQKGLQAGY